ncbi:MAG: restriction endonuclease [Oscillochloris sp.]|nr:restriction endonuclease [Oscillochloris sp.]
MPVSATSNGRGLERTVAECYRAMGAVLVEHDRELGGNQIDVYVEMQCPDRSLLRVAIETKEWGGIVGVKVVNAFATIVGLLRQRSLVDIGIIVSDHGFTRPARQAAAVHQIRLLEISDLQAMASIPASSAPNPHLDHSTMTDTAGTGQGASLIVTIGWRILGASGGAISGLALGAVTGLVFSQLLIGTALGMVFGAVYGVIRGPRSWLLVSGGVDIGFLGAVIGAAMAVSANIWSFASSSDGAFLGGVIGIAFGWLLRNRVVEVIDGLFPAPLLRGIARAGLGPVVGVQTGALLGYGLVESLTTGKIAITMPLVAAIYGAFTGALLSIVIAWSLCQAILSLHSFFIQTIARAQRS